MIHLPSLVLGGILVASLAVSGYATAQETPTTSTDDVAVQTVNVGTLSYALDPFYVVGCFKISVDSHQEWTGEDVVSTGAAQMQCFHRNEQGKMVPWEGFPTTNDGVLDHTDLGQAMYAGPQGAATP